MNDHAKFTAHPPPDRQAIQAKCFHPSGTFIEFGKEEVEQSMCLDMECLRLFLGGC